MAEELSEGELSQRVDLLRLVPLYGDLRESELRQLARLCNTGSYAADQEIYHQSDITQTMFIVRTGRVALYHVDTHGEEALVGYRTGFDPYSEAPFDGWLGEGSVLLGDPHDVTALTLAPVATLEITRDMLRDASLDIWPRLTPQNPSNAARVKYLDRQFDWLDKDEIVIKYVNQHAFSLIRVILVPLGLFVLLALVTAVLSQLLPGLTGLAVVLSTLLPAVAALFIFYDWRDDFYVVTTKRVVHIDEVPWGRKMREEAALANIQEIQVSRLSPTAQALDFGDLKVETLGSTIDMRYVPQADEMRALIMGEKRRVLARSRAAARKAIYQELASRVGQPDRSTLTPAPPSAPPAPPPRSAYSAARAARGTVRYFLPPLREEQGDRVIYRTHWVALLRRGALSFLFFACVLCAMANWVSGSYPFGGLPNSIWVVWPALVAGAAAWAWWIFEDWRNDVYIIAPDRIIDIHRLPLLFRQTRREAALDRVQTIEAIIPSSVARFLKYGTVNVAIPGSTFQLKDVSNPAAIQIEISRRIEAYKRSQAQAAERGRRSELSDWFAVYDQIRQGYRPPGTLGAGERGNHGSA